MEFLVLKAGCKIMKSTSEINSYPLFLNYNEQDKKRIMENLSDYIENGRVNLKLLYCRGLPPNQNRLLIGQQYSKKVFIGGLPFKINKGQLIREFRQFGPLEVNFPDRSESGYAFLIFQNKSSVQLLLNSCSLFNKFLLPLSPFQSKTIEIRPWLLQDADYVFDTTAEFNLRMMVFIGGLDRTTTAAEVADAINFSFGNVCYVGIDIDELCYPKSYGRIIFNNEESYKTAIRMKFFFIKHRNVLKRVEMKPYILCNQNCDGCHGLNCRGKFADFFCNDVLCLKYYCEHCWFSEHGGLFNHKPVIKRKMYCPELEDLERHFGLI